MARFTSALAQRYVTALLAVVGDRTADLAQLTGSISAFLKMIETSADLRALLASPLVSVTDQDRAMAAILDRGGFDPVFARFVRVVIRHRRAADLADILTAVLFEIDKRAGIIEAVVDTATPITGDQEKQLVTLLSRATGATVRLKNRVANDVVGGMRVRYNDVMIDDTVSGKLARLSKALGTRVSA